MADQNIYVSYAELGQMFSITAFSSNNNIKSLRSIQMQDSLRDIPHVQLKQVKCQNQDIGQTNNSPIIYKSRGFDQDDNVGNRKTTKFRSKNETSSKEQKILAINSQISESAFGNNQINRLKGQVQQQKEKICVLEQNEIYYKIEVCRLKGNQFLEKIDQNQSLEETNKRLTQHLQGLFEKQKNMITDNKLEQTNYLELNLKLLEYESRQVRKSRERSKTRQQDVSSFALSDKASRLKITKVLTNSGSRLPDSDYQSNSLFLSKVKLKNQVSEQTIGPLKKISSNGEPECARRASPKPRRNQNYQI